MKILVTGGAGYIGSHVTIELCEAGFDVVVLDDLSLGFEANIDTRAEFIEGSTHDSFLLKKVLNDGVDAVIHLAAWKAAGESMENPDKYLYNNLQGTLNLIHEINEADIKRFVFSSTAAVFGYPQYLPVDEDHPVEPINYYGYTKLAIERNLAWFSKLKNLHYAALRYFNAAGYDVHQRVTEMERNPANLLPIVMEVAAGIRRKFQVFGNDYDTHDGTGVRDYIHVNDLATAHVKALQYLVDAQTDLTVNLATGDGYSVLDVVKETEKVTGQKIPHEFTSRRPGDPAALVATSNQADHLLNWKPQYSDLKTILSSMWSLYEKKE